MVVSVPVLSAVQRSEQARQMASEGVSVVVRDYTTPDRVRREVQCLAPRSRAMFSRWFERPDVYWLSRLFSAQRAWVSGADMGGPERWSTVAGAIVLSGQPADVYRRRYVKDPAALTAAAEQLACEPWISAVATVRGAGRATGAQLSALCSFGSRGGDAGFLSAAKPLAKAEVLEMSWHHAAGLAHPRAMAWQIRTGDPHTAWARTVAASGLAASGFGCMPLMVEARSDASRPRNTRHQVLAVEAALRAMEVSDTWVGWMPETACRPEWFLPPGHPSRARDLRLISDGCLIRSDGARVFVEIEASMSSRNAERFSQRVQQWSQMFDDGTFGGALLMIAAGPVDQIGMIAAELRRAVSENASAKARRRMLVGSWLDYSPDLGLVSEDCATLRAARYESGRWRECCAADIEVDGAEAGIVERLGGLSFTPRWAQPAAETR